MGYGKISQWAALWDGPYKATNHRTTSHEFYILLWSIWPFI